MIGAGEDNFRRLGPRASAFNVVLHVASGAIRPSSAKERFSKLRVLHFRQSSSVFDGCAQFRLYLLVGNHARWREHSIYVPPNGANTVFSGAPMFLASRSLLPCALERIRKVLLLERGWTQWEQCCSLFFFLPSHPSCSGNSGRAGFFAICHLQVLID